MTERKGASMTEPDIYDAVAEFRSMTEHTAADAPNREEGYSSEGTKGAAAGVPDVWSKHEGGRGWQKGEQPNPQWACARYDELRATGKHGHYETLMRVVKDACYRAHDLGMEDSKAANPPPAGVSDVEPIAWCVRYDGPPSCDGIHSNPTMHKPDAEALAARAGLVLVELVPAAALAALQSQLADANGRMQSASENLIEAKRLLAEEETQQAERIKEMKATYEEMCAILMGSLPLGMCTEGPLHALKNLVGRCAVNEAKLAEAVEALRSGNPDARMNVLKTAREVMG